MNRGIEDPSLTGIEDPSLTGIEDPSLTGIILKRLSPTTLTLLYKSFISLMLRDGTYNHLMLLLIDTILEQNIDPKELPCFIKEIDILFNFYQPTSTQTYFNMNIEILKELKITFQ